MYVSVYTFIHQLWSTISCLFTVAMNQVLALSKLIWNACINKVMLTLSINSLQYADIQHRPPLVHSIPKHSQSGLMITFNHHTAAINVSNQMCYHNQHDGLSMVLHNRNLFLP